MAVRATPSLSAHTISSPIGSDSLRKIVLFALALATATTGQLKVALTMGGILGSIIILLANLGARSWRHMQWKPLRYQGYGSFLLAYITAVLTGLFFPYMGHRSVAAGGKCAMEYVIKTSAIVAFWFVLSDFDEIRKYLVVGSQVSAIFVYGLNH